jgi:RTX calcium-binding nonapeptide repeat (4 copies)
VACSSRRPIVRRRSRYRKQPQQFIFANWQQHRPFAFISIPVAFDSSHNATEFIQYSITTTDTSLYAPTSAPTPDDVVAAANRYASYPSYQNVDSPNDCHFIAQDVASAAGAALDDPTESTDPTTNVSAGFWRVVYRGSDYPNPDSNWSKKVQKGDIVRVGWTNGGAHTFTVVDVGAYVQGSDGLLHRDLTVYDNGVPDNNGIPGVQSSLIGLHDDFVENKWYDEWSDPTQVTIYRLSPDHQYLIDESQLGGDDPNHGARLVGTANNDQIIGANGDDTISSWIGNDLIDGGGGLNTLDYSWDTNPVSVDLWGGTASKGNGWTDQFVNIQSFIGGSVSDVFYGAAAKCTFDGGKGWTTHPPITTSTLPLM